ncbi:uncharacterized protein LOC110850868 isoform X2 [Folsomia candida]|uniref:uncharacterized protein LOC110850868 isoform X2 n=1 Tax=Folsomia candida TaxID=158441 RepID=UPI001604B684|nr:uncharacterized protein LOC110850868 isoform X2 [Folsomia candida]
MDAVDVGLSSPDKRHEDTPSNPPRTPLSLDQATIILAKHTLATPCLKVLHHDRILNPRNTTYTLTSSDGKDYILRFSESWGTKTENEVAAISYIAKNTSLPVPKVVGFCTDSAESPTKYEYILMEKLRGVPIGYLFKNLSLSKKITVVRNMTKILKIFQSLTFDQCGSFYFNKTDTESKVEMKDVKVGPLFRSPHCSPFSNYLEYLQQLINSGIERMQTSRILMDGEGPVLLERIQNFRDKVCNLETTPLSEKVKNVQFVFTHLDLHSFNILIDEETFEITGVIDFEFSGVHPIDQDWFECFSFAGICNKSRDVFGDGSNENHV